MVRSVLRPGTTTLSSWFLCAALVLGACSSDEGRRSEPSDAGAGGDAAVPIDYPTIDCDPLVPSFCGLPFPSNVHTVADETTPTGRRLALGADMMPPAESGALTLPDVWNEADGFSPGAALIAHFPTATGEGLPGPNDITRSVEDDSPTVIVDAETGERIPHFSELDRSGSVDEERALLIRPVVRLADARRYLVAVRGLKSGSGDVEPSPAFRALRDDEPSDEPSVEARRGLYRDIFDRLADAGVARDDLQLAWDFTTASRESNTGRFLRMRDDALARLGDGGPPYRIESVVEPEGDQNIAYEIDLLMEVPLYLEAPEPENHLVLDEDGLPKVNTERPSYEVGVKVLIPHSALDEPAKLMQYGHGLLGSRDQIRSGHFRSFCNQYNYIIFGVDLVGMAEDDILPIAGMLGSGELHRLATMFDRLHQGMLNSLLAMRLMSRSFAEDPTYGALVNPEQRFYHGISQGGIFGGVYMAVTTDVARGVLDVMGQPYNLLLNRSVDFDPFFQILGSAYPSALDQQLVLSLVQLLWDRLEPNGYTPYIRQNLLPNTPPHEVLMHAALGDHQVTTLGAHVMARSVGAKHVESGLRDIFGLEKVSSLTEGSGYIEYGFGLPEDPPCNLPQRLCEDPHGKVRTLEAAREQMDLFFRTGEIRNFCEGGVCEYPELSGCLGMESNEGVCD